jgi:UDP-N-acetylmuramate--alanine ligase
MRYHIVGIAGSGMSAIAHILLDQGHTVSGSDPQQTALAGALAARGATVHQGHAAAYVAGADALVVTSAVQPEHVELQAARARGIPVLKRADLWAQWSRQRPTVAVAGSAGKTTTTAMIALGLARAGLEPGFLVGGEAPDLGVNARWGNPIAPLVIEADEYDRTFLALAPQVAVITNVAWDHPDTYPSVAEYEAAFTQFAASVPNPRNLIICGDDPGALRVAGHPDATQYGIDEAIARDPASCRLAPLDWSAARVRVEEGLTRFDIWRYDRATFATRLAGSQTLAVPGAHNVRTSLAALAACAALGAPLAQVAEALASYSGVRRRFELKGEAAGVTVVDDYAHHPAKVQATLEAARSRYPDRRLVVYLQPHTYSRTRALLAEWPAALAEADLVLVGDVYAAREHDTLGINAALLAATLGGAARPAGDIAEAARLIAELAQPGDIVLTLGAGDSYRVAELVLDELRGRNE